MPRYVVDVSITVDAPDQETAWIWVSSQVNDALSVPEVIEWETSEPQEAVQQTMT